MPRKLGIALYVLLVVIWSSAWVAIKIALGDAPALLEAGVRFALAGALLLPFAFCGLVYGEAITDRAIAGAALVVAGLLAARGGLPAAVRGRPRVAA